MPNATPHSIVDQTIGNPQGQECKLTPQNQVLALLSTS